MPKLIDRTDDRYGMLVVKRKAVIPNAPTSYWECVCDCGNKKTVCGSALSSGRTRSCGCLNAQASSQRATRRNLKHGHNPRKTGSVSSTYVSWQAAKHRCDDRDAKHWRNYGGIGVTMCERWRNSFVNFLEDMGARPAGKTLDRWPNPFGDYEPGNCRWATPKEQASNKRANHAQGHEVFGALMPGRKAAR